MTAYEVTLIDVARLRPTEEVDAAHVETLAADIRCAAVLRQPVLIERRSLAILDGHHRYHAARRLGLARIAAIVIDYDDPRLSLSSWTGAPFTRGDVLAAAASGRLLAPKSTRHQLDPAPAPAPVALADLERPTSSP
ncbi:MAG: ParB N-terminal domain-containing protein [Alphaproteobacteria bacterium]|nr:ParB N-terminal domain-containing protein [Alphaproteobacteria bacterium]